MFGVDDMLIGAGAGILGNTIAGLFGSRGQHEANVTNMQIARENQAFQERMSSTAYQRSMQDMRLAGLNPILAFTKGGASTPSGSTATVSNEAAPLSEALGRVSSSAANLLRNKLELDNLRSQNVNIQQDTLLKAAQNEAATADARQKVASARNLDIEADRLAAETTLTRTQIPGRQFESKMDSMWYGKLMHILGRLNPFSNSALNLSRIVK